MKKHEVDEPSVPSAKTSAPMGDCSEFKKEAQNIAYGQAGKSGCKSDKSKISAQLKNYNWVD